MKLPLLWPVVLLIAGCVNAACPPAQPQVLLERFIPADCAACWRAMPPNPAPGKSAITLDWVIPAPPGAVAPLAAAALFEAAPRAAPEGRLEANETVTRSHPLSASSALKVEVEDGPAWNGYIGVAMTVLHNVTRPLPKDLSGWVALVERIDAGSDDTPVDRLLVRSLAGPIALDALAQREPVEHLRALRVPESGKPERLHAVAWVEAGKGRVVAVGRGSFKDCPVP